MEYLDQTKFGPDEGNCFAACVASLLGLAVDDVPDFGQGKKCWLRLFEEWLKPRGLAPVIIHGKGAIFPHGVHYLAGGMSPRGIPHSVIYLDGAMVHDPHLDREGLECVTDYTFLVPADARGPLPALRRLVEVVKEVRRMLYDATSHRVRGLSLRGCGKAHGILSNALFAVDHPGEKESELPTSGGTDDPNSPGANRPPAPPRTVTQEERSGRECPYPRDEDLERKWEPRDEPPTMEDSKDDEAT